MTTPDEEEEEEIEFDLAAADDDYEEPINWDEVGEDAREQFAPPPPEKPVDQRLLQAVRRHRLLSAARILDMPPIDWFVQDLFPLGFTVVHGSGGSYKSFLVLDWMLCADQGIQWHGHDIRPGKCLYIAGEGAAGIGKRLRAWCHHHEIEPEAIGVTFMAEPINLFTANDEVLDIVRELIRLGEFDYVVVDTLHTVAGGADENSSKDVGLVFAKAKRIAGRSTLFFVHHSQKQGKAYRGSSAIRDDSDLVLTVEKIDDRDLAGVIRPDKVRDAEAFRPINFHLEVVHPDDSQASLVVAHLGNQSIDPLASAQSQRLLNYVHDNPGSSTVRIKQALSLKSSDWRAKAGPLIDSGQIVPIDGPSNAKLWFIAGDEPEEESHADND